MKDDESSSNEVGGMISQVNYVGVDEQQFRHSSTSHIHLEQQRNESMQHPQPQHLEYYGSQQHSAQQSFQAISCSHSMNSLAPAVNCVILLCKTRMKERLSGPPFVSLAPSGEFTDGNFINASEALSPTYAIPLPPQVLRSNSMLTRT